jgi:uncharacterized protein
VPWSSLSPHWFVGVHLLAGSLVGVWVGATWARRMRSATLYRVLAVLLVLIAAALAWSHFGHLGALDLPPAVRLVAGWSRGRPLELWRPGGELLIPTIVLLYGVDIRIAGSLSLAVSLPTMLVAFVRYSRDASFAVLRQQRGFVLTMAAGSMAGTVIEGGSSLASCLVSSSSRCLSFCSSFHRSRCGGIRDGPSQRQAESGRVSPWLGGSSPAWLCALLPNCCQK